MICGVHVLACFVIVVEERLSFLDVSFRKEEYSCLAIDLATHRLHVLL